MRHAVRKREPLTQKCVFFCKRVCRALKRRPRRRQAAPRLVGAAGMA